MASHLQREMNKNNTGDLVTEAVSILRRASTIIPKSYT